MEDQFGIVDVLQAAEATAFGRHHRMSSPCARRASKPGSDQRAASGVAIQKSVTFPPTIIEVDREGMIGGRVSVVYLNKSTGSRLHAALHVGVAQFFYRRDYAGFGPLQPILVPVFERPQPCIRSGLLPGRRQSLCWEPGRTLRA